MKQRILEFIEKSGLKTAQFERICGLSNGYVKNMRRSLGDEKLNDVLRAFPNLSKIWLLTGEGEMLVNSPVHHNTITIDASESVTAGDNSNVTTGAGSPITTGDADTIKRLEAEIESLKAQIKAKDEQIASLHTILANITNK